MVKTGALIALPVIVAGVGALVMGEALKEPRIGQDFCYASNGPRPNAAFFVDVSFTGDTSAAQDRDLTRALNDAYSTLPANGRLSVFTTANAVVGSLPVPVLSVCRPPANEQEQDALGLGSKPAPYRFLKPEPFEGVAVNVLLIEFGTLPSSLLPFCTSDEVRAFWPDYFRNNGAASVQLSRLRYGGL